MPIHLDNAENDLFEELLKIYETDDQSVQRDQPTPSARHRPLATAEFEDALRLTVEQNAKGVLYLGNEDPGSMDTIGICNDQHAICVGATRSAKNVSFIIPNLLIWEGSALVVDCKAENAMVTARRRGNGSKHCTGMGQRVYILDPFGIAGRPDDPFHDLQAQYNVLADLDPNDPRVIDQVNAIASSMIMIVPESGSTYWLEAARWLLKATILHVISSPDIMDDDRNLVHVYKLLCYGDREKKLFLEEIGADQIPPSHLLLFKAMEANSAFDDLIASTGETYADMVANAYKQYCGVIETLKVNLEFMDSPGMQECLMASSFSLEDLKDDPAGVTIYLCIPFEMLETHFRWLRMLIIRALSTFERQRYLPKAGQPVLMVLDEFAALQKMPSLQKGIAQMAGFGVKFLLAVQDLNQLKDVYKDAWETFISNCGIRLFLSNEDHFTRDYASKLVGEAEVRVHNQNSSHTDTTNNTGTASTSTAEGNTGGETKTTGRGYGRNHSLGPGLMVFSHGGNSSSNASTALSKSRTSTETKSRSISTTTGFSSSIGKQINIQTRPLVRPDEMGRYFAYRPSPDGEPYVGQTLLLLSGEQPISIRRTLYYRHIRFVGLFDPHIDHQVQPPYIPPPPEYPFQRQQLEALTFDDVLPFPAEPQPRWWQRLLNWVGQQLRDRIHVQTGILFTKVGLFGYWLPLSACMLALVIIGARR